MTSRISIHVSNYTPYVWDVDHVATLRSEHRICGVLSGTLPHLSQQNVFLGLPLVLMPEELVLLVEKQLATIVHDSAAHHTPTPAQLEAWDASRRQDIITHQLARLERQRKGEGEDRAGAGAAAKAATAAAITATTTTTTTPDHQDAIAATVLQKRAEREARRQRRRQLAVEAAEAEAEEAVANADGDGDGPSWSSTTATAVTGVVAIAGDGEERRDTSASAPAAAPTSTSDAVYTVSVPTTSDAFAWYSYSSPSPSDPGVAQQQQQHTYETLDAARAAGVWNYPTNAEERARCEVFRDLWEKGYYMGGGSKFGGDWLVYPGDPLRYHSHFVATVQTTPSAPLRPMEVVAHGRLGTATKKAHLLCGWDPVSREVTYISIEWAGFG
ncbi:hypothetical protein BJV74DRAFT_972857 [Russula compacta]|nr:hypothetical protein BJV74DRAFT_972857 [Russula compacta]